MLKPDKFLLTDVRCFKGEKQFDIRPLTFLIGQNSTGKSTALGCLQAAGTFVNDTLGRRFLFERSAFINFNTEPYEMGSFANIVSNQSRNVRFSPK